jgi:4-amino-4-deoxy-L-arabinose transferase-like glycosyltransferase
VALLSRLSAYRWPLCILAVGLAVRLAWTLAIPVRPLSDSAAYDQLAWNLASRGAYVWNNGDVTAYWPVGTAFIYSLVFRLFGHSLAFAAALNVVVGTLSLGLIMALAQKWFSSKAAVIAGGIYALWPSQIEFSSILASELLFNFTLLLALWITSVAPIRSWVLKAVLAGMCLAGAAYIRPTALPLVALLAAALFWRGGANWRELTHFSLATLLAMAVCIAPWTVRNLRELGAPVLVSTNGTANLWMGNNPAATGAYIPLPDYVSGLSEVERSKLLGDRAEQFILDHPGSAAALAVRKLVITHDRETIGVSWNEASLRPIAGALGIKLAKAVSTLYWWLALALGAIGAILLFYRNGWRGVLHPALLAWIYFALVHAVTVGADRYHFPSIPFIAMLAGYAVANITPSIFNDDLCHLRLLRGRTTSIPH